MRGVGLLVGLGLSWGCGGATGGGDAGTPAGAGGALYEAAPLEPALEIPATSWVPATAAEDPFVAFEPGRLRCSPFAFREEASWLEVTTTDCNYATLVSRFAREVVPGDVLRGEVAWATLASLEPAVGTLAFASAREGVLWEHEVAIPGEADIVRVALTFTQPAPAGSALYFHVRNHGYNAWQLSPLTLTDPPQ